MDKVIATEQAKQVIRLLKNKHGDLLFEQSFGCCDGTSPMCHRAKGHYISSQLLLLGHLEDVPYYVDKNQYEYMKHTQIVIDAIEGQGAAFSLESAEGYAFMLKSKPFEK